MRTQSAYETRNSLEYQRVKKRRRKVQRVNTLETQKVKRKGLSKLVNTAFYTLGTLISIASVGIIGIAVNNLSSNHRIKSSFEKKLEEYKDNIDRDGNGIISDTERVSLYDRMLRTAGMVYENGRLYFRDIDKKVSVDELAKAIESYSEPIFINREGIK